MASSMASSWTGAHLPLNSPALRGDTVRFILPLHPEGGFNAPVEVVAPDPPLLVSTVTVDATVTATGGGTVRMEQVQLVIQR